MALMLELSLRRTPHIGRPNAYPHSEIDFGTFKWSAYGAQFISDLGYGSIAAGYIWWDLRRHAQLDNNPAGHNTLVIREAFVKSVTNPAIEKNIDWSKLDAMPNFSQLNFKGGVTRALKATGIGLSCVELDGSVVYGSTHAAGWLSHMRRYTYRAFVPHLDLIRAPYVLYGVKYIDLVSLGAFVPRKYLLYSHISVYMR